MLIVISWYGNLFTSAGQHPFSLYFASGSEADQPSLVVEGGALKETDERAE